MSRRYRPSATISTFVTTQMAACLDNSVVGDGTRPTLIGGGACCGVVVKGAQHVIGGAEHYPLVLTFGASGMMSQAKLSNRAMGAAVLIAGEAIPLDQHIEQCHRERQEPGEIPLGAMDGFLTVADLREHRKGGLDEHAVIPGPARRPSCWTDCPLCVRTWCQRTRPCARRSGRRAGGRCGRGRWPYPRSRRRPVPTY